MPLLFLELPAEIRNHILRLLLTHSTPIITCSCNQLAPPKPTNLGLTPHILLSSRKTYHEGLTILYGENTFQAHPSYLTDTVFAMDPTRKVISKLCVSMIRRFHIRVRRDCDPYYKSEDVRRVFSGAEELEVEVFRASWGCGGYDALEGFSHVRGVKKAKVHGSVGNEFAKWLEGVMESGVGTGTLQFETSDERYDDR